jgi:prevent-host-death family protein
MGAGEFKARCLAVMDEVNSTGEAVVITKRGKPVARLLPSQQASDEDPDSIFGFMQGMGSIAGEIVFPEFSDEDWKRMEDERWARFEPGSSK